jgi:cyanophycinase
MTQLALVGSGEYLPSMLEFEKLISKPGKYVQIALAAGKEGDERLAYWKKLGEAQALRLNMEPLFLPVFDRGAAENFTDSISDAGLIYFSGGDPGYLVKCIENTALWNSVWQAVQNGVSLAGCSAGAMMMGPEVLGFGSIFGRSKNGLGLINWNVIPHYDKFGKYFNFGLNSETSNVIGIDEETALYQAEGVWRVWGKGQVHFTGKKFNHGDIFEI